MENVNRNNKEVNEINKERIQRHKKGVLDIFKSKKYDLQEEVKEEIENFLDIELKNHKITEEEYDILNDFLQELFQKESTQKESIQKESIQKEPTEDSAKKFREQMKKLPIIDAITIYKGEFRGKAPEKKKNSGNNLYNGNTQKEGDER